MLADEAPEWNARAPQTIGGTPVGLDRFAEALRIVRRVANFGLVRRETARRDECTVAQMNANEICSRLSAGEQATVRPCA